MSRMDRTYRVKLNIFVSFQNVLEYTKGERVVNLLECDKDFREKLGYRRE